MFFVNKFGRYWGYDDLNISVLLIHEHLLFEKWSKYSKY